jgi:hypothetical protein
MPLIVQHDHVRVEPAFVEQNIGPKRPGRRNALGDCRCDRRRDDLDLLAAEEATFAGVRIEPADGDLRSRDAELLGAR